MNGKVKYYLRRKQYIKISKIDSFTSGGIKFSSTRSWATSPSIFRAFKGSPSKFHKFKL